MTRNKNEQINYLLKVRRGKHGGMSNKDFRQQLNLLYNLGLKDNGCAVNLTPDVSLNIKDLSIDNLIIFEACTYIVKGVYMKEVEGGGEIPLLKVKPLYHDWEPELCQLSEISGLPLTIPVLLKMGFVDSKGDSSCFELRSSEHSIEYNISNKMLCIDSSRIIYDISYFHQLQNTCTHNKLPISFGV